MQLIEVTVTGVLKVSRALTFDISAYPWKAYAVVHMLYAHTQIEEGAVPCMSCAWWERTKLSITVQSNLSCLEVFGPLFQGTRTSKVIFLFVERQQGVRIEKGNKSYCVINKVRSPFKKSLIFSSTQPPSARPRICTWREEKAFAHLLGNMIPHLSSPSCSLMYWKENSAPLHFKIRCLSTSHTESQMTENGETGVH